MIVSDDRRAILHIVITLANHSIPSWPYPTTTLEHTNPSWWSQAVANPLFELTGRSLQSRRSNGLRTPSIFFLATWVLIIVVLSCLWPRISSAVLMSYSCSERCNDKTVPEGIIGLSYLLVTMVSDLTGFCQPKFHMNLTRDLNSYTDEIIDSIIKKEWYI